MPNKKSVSPLARQTELKIS
jgi:hypothetical protein